LAVPLGAAAHAASRPSVTAWQATVPSASVTEAGTSVRQRPLASGQRGLNGHPAGGVIGFGI